MTEKTYRLTFSHGMQHDFVADRLEDDERWLTLWLGDELVYKIGDSDITKCEIVETVSVEGGEAYGRKSYALTDGDGNTIAVYRNSEAAAQTE